MRTVNPVSLVKEEDWKPSEIKCNHCKGDCREVDDRKSFTGKDMKLVNCLNQDHCNGEYGFSVYG